MFFPVDRGDKSGFEATDPLPALALWADVLPFCASTSSALPAGNYAGAALHGALVESGSVHAYYS
jgi:hypothetical protein